MDERLKAVIKECIEDIEKAKWSGEGAASYAAGYLHEYPELRKLMMIIADMKR